MLRFLFLSAAALAAVPAAAAEYHAKPASPAAGRIIARDIVWHCAGSACRAASDQSRPVVICQALARRAGRLDGFAVDGRAFDNAELNRCNAFAPARTATVVAERE